MKKAIIIIVASLVALGGTFAALWFFTDVFSFLKPANDNFSMQAKKLLGTEKEPEYSDYEKFLNNLKVNSSYTSDLELSMNMSVPSSVMSYSDQRLLNSSSLKLSQSYDEKSKASAISAGLYKDSKEVLTLDAIQKDSTIALKSDDLTDKKYLKFDLMKLEDFCKKNNVEFNDDMKESIETLSKMKDVDSSKLMYDLFYLSEDDFKSINKNYGNLLVDLIDEDKYEKGKKQEVSVNGKDVKADTYTLTLTGEDAYDFIKGLAERSKNDATLKKLVKDKYEVIKKYVESLSELSNDEIGDLPSSISDSDYDKLFEELISELEDSKDVFKSIKGSVKVTIYSYKNNPVKVDIALAKDEDDDGSVIFTEVLEDGKNTYSINVKNIMKLSGSDDSSTDTDSSLNPYSRSADSLSSYSSLSTKSTKSSMSTLSSFADAVSEIVLVDKYEETDTSRKGTLTAGIKASGQSQDLIEIKYDFVNSDSELKCNMSVGLASGVGSLIGMGDVSASIVYEITGLNTDKADMKFELSGKYSSYSLKVSANGSMSKKSDIPELTSSNSIDVFALSQEDLLKTYTSVVTNAANLLPSRLSSYGIKVTKDEILALIPSTPAEEPSTEAPAEEPAA